MKLKTFQVYWRAEIEGVDEIEAFDENDAEEQFDSIICDDRIPQDKQIYAEIEEIILKKKRREKK